MIINIASYKKILNMSKISLQLQSEGIYPKIKLFDPLK